MVPVESCRICGQSSLLEETGRVINNKFPLYKCAKCKTVLVSQEHIQENSSTTYNDLFATGEYEMHRKIYASLSRGKVPLEYYRQRLLRTTEKTIVGRKMVEIGGGLGSFGMYCHQRGWDYIDFDVSNVAVKHLLDIGLHAELLDSSQPVFPSTDVVAMWEVIEHVSNVNEYLQAIHKSLKPDGILMLSTPNYLRRGYRTTNQWGEISSPPVHINFFTEESIKTALHILGFKKVSVLKKRFHRPNLRGISGVENLLIALGIEQVKTLYVFASV